jgi:hypothetical protein
MTDIGLAALKGAVPIQESWAQRRGVLAGLNPASSRRAMIKSNLIRRDFFIVPVHESKSVSTRGVAADKKEDDLAVQYLHHALMNETREYVLRGRALAEWSDAEVQDLWVATFERWFGERTTEHQRNNDDAAAELRHRKLEPPYDRVKAKN